MDPILLIAVPLICFAGAFLSTVAAMGGGLLVVAGCSQLLPLATVVPLTSAFNLFAHGCRALQFRQSIDWGITGPFIPGALFAAVLGSFIYLSLPEAAIALLLGSVMLWFTWVPRGAGSARLRELIPWPYFWVGFIQTFLATIAGVGGLLQSMMAGSTLPRQTILATIAGAMFVMSLFKVGAFMAAGFAFERYLSMIALSWAAAMLGTRAGKRCLHLFSDHAFRNVIRAMVTLFALRLFWQAGESILQA